jgi:6-phosphogluconolactonase (cycloisomerase 2 family)
MALQSSVVSKALRRVGVPTPGRPDTNVTLGLHFGTACRHLEASKKELHVKTFTRMALGAGAVLGLSAWLAPVAGAEGSPPGSHVREGGDHAVFVQTDNIAGNQIVAYHRDHDGTLDLASTYATKGLGGVLNGSVVDHLGSQGSLASDPKHSLLYAVNAGSNTVSVFSVDGDQLSLLQVVGSGGTFPVSIAVHDDLVYVLNAEDGGSVSGYRVDDGGLHPIWGSTRSLELTIPTDTTQFTHTPGQVAFSPDGTQLIVTTKANVVGNDIDVFGVSSDGRLSHSPVTNSEPGTVPFAISFDQAGHLVIGEAGPSALVTFRLHRDGTVTQLDSLANGQPGLCWVTAASNFFFTGNTASNSTSGYQSSFNGQLTLLGSTPTDPGTVDASSSANGRFLYVQTGGKGVVDEFQVNADGSLTEVGSVTVAGAIGGEGIVAF